MAPKGEGKLFLHQFGESEGTQSEIEGVWGTLMGHMLFYRGLHLGLTCAYEWVVSRGVTRPAVSPQVLCFGDRRSHLRGPFTRPAAISDAQRRSRLPVCISQEGQGKCQGLYPGDAGTFNVMWLFG